MAIAIRKKDGKFYSPNRDVNNWFVPATRSAIKLASEAFKDDQQALQRLQECGVALAESFNAALLADKMSVQDVMAQAATAMHRHPAEFSVLARIFMMIVLWRFISGSREQVDTPEMSERELTLAMTDAGMLAELPDDLAGKVTKALRLSAQLPPEAFDLPALFAISEDEPKPDNKASDGPCLRKTSE